MSQSETSKLMGIVTGEQNQEKRGITIAFTSLIAILYLFIIALFMIALVMQGVLKPAMIVGFVMIHVVVLVTRAFFS